MCSLTHTSDCPCISGSQQSCFRSSLRLVRSKIFVSAPLPNIELLLLIIRQVRIYANGTLKNQTNGIHISQRQINRTNWFHYIETRTGPKNKNKKNHQNILPMAYSTNYVLKPTRKHLLLRKTLSEVTVMTDGQSNLWRSYL